MTFYSSNFCNLSFKLVSFKVLIHYYILNLVHLSLIKFGTLFIHNLFCELNYSFTIFMANPLIFCQIFIDIFVKRSAFTLPVLLATIRLTFCTSLLLLWPSFLLVIHAGSEQVMNCSFPLKGAMHAGELFYCRKKASLQSVILSPTILLLVLLYCNITFIIYKIVIYISFINVKVKIKWLCFIETVKHGIKQLKKNQRFKEKNNVKLEIR